MTQAFRIGLAVPCLFAFSSYVEPNAPPIYRSRALLLRILIVGTVGISFTQAFLLLALQLTSVSNAALVAPLGSLFHY